MKNRNFLDALRYAIEGVVHGVRSERNIRFHFFAAVVVIIIGFITKISTMEWSIIFIVIFGVLSLEYINASLERAVDKASPEIHPLAKQAKDLAAAAVFLFATCSVIIGMLIFLPKWLP